MPKLRRLTIVTLDPERLARFYEQVFEMRRVPNPKGEAIYLSDGYFNLTLIPNRAEGKPSGLNHIGFDVAPEEAERLLARFEKWGLSKPASRAGKRSFADLRGTDPDGNNMDISTHGFPTG
ncbi:MAG TPA: VOC family protein [Candidatus Binatia bacterium]|nr:VOC family protein [Candidatus Binatia bacterium]